MNEKESTGATKKQKTLGEKKGEMERGYVGRRQTLKKSQKNNSRTWESWGSARPTTSNEKKSVAPLKREKKEKRGLRKDKSR